MGIKKPDNSDMTIRSAIQKLKKGTLNLDHRIQRRGAWNELQKQLFISSILENVKIPGVVIIEENGIRYAIDGKQRITAGTEYLENKFALNPNVEYIKDIDIDELEPEEEISLQDIAGRFYSELPQAVKNKLHTFVFKLDIYKDMTGEQIKKLFKRYNGGTPLNKAQLLHCDSDFMNDFVNELCSNYFFKDVVNVTVKMRDKFADENVIKQCLLLLYSKDTGIEDIDLKFFVAEMEDIKDSTDYVELLDKMKTITEYLNVSFEGPVKELRRTHIPVVVITAQEAITRNVEAKDFGKWVKEFLTNNTGKVKNSEYKDLSGSGASKKANITRRIELALNNFNSSVSSVIIEESEPEEVETEKNELMVIEQEQIQDMQATA